MRKRYLAFFLITFYYCSIEINQPFDITFKRHIKKSIPPKRDLPIYYLKVTEAGYDFEEHKIKTSDGYILTAWRIPGKINENKGKRMTRKPIILQHGLCDSSYSWLVLDKEHALPFLLADNGYDVWLTNTRGNALSYEHENKAKYDSNDMYSKYWDFSFHEMAIYDLPANINYIKLLSVYDKVSYICHSQGGLIYFILYTINPSYVNQSIDKFFSVGTVINIFTTTSQMIKLTSRFYLSSILDRIKIKNIMCFPENIYHIMQKFCQTMNKVCFYILNYIVSNNYPTNRVDPQEFFNNFLFIPAGTSAKNVRHWTQTYRKKILSPFDYGFKKNMKIYNRPIPPPYNMTQFQSYTIDSYIFTSDKDPFSNMKDLQYLLKYLADKPNVEIINVENYNHLDFLWSKDATRDIYSKILSILEK